MQNSINIANGTGAEVRANINNAFQSVSTDFAGATDISTMTPNNAFPFSKWIDTGNGLVKRRNANNTAWINTGTVDPSGNIFMTNAYGQNGVMTISQNTTLSVTDTNKVIISLSSNNITLSVPNTNLTEYLSYKVYNRGSGTLEITGGTFYGSTGSATSIILNQYQSVNIVCDGESFYTI